LHALVDGLDVFLGHRAALDVVDKLVALARLVGLDAQLAMPVVVRAAGLADVLAFGLDRKSTRLNSSHDQISYAVFCLKKKTFYGSVSIWIRACSSSSTSVATTGSLPTNSGISPYLIRSSRSTVRRISLMSLPFFRLLT